MATYFLDTSALIKRYLSEKGSNWIRQVVFVPTNYLLIARITQVEVASVFARKARGNFISTTDEMMLLSLFQQDLRLRFGIVELDEPLTMHAASLAHVHGLRAYDAVQLACALKANSVISTLGAGNVNLLCADSALRNAGASEQLVTDNPENYP